MEEIHIRGLLETEKARDKGKSSTGKIGAPLLRATVALKTVKNREEEEEQSKREGEKANARSWKAKRKERGEARNCRFHSDLYLYGIPRECSRARPGQDYRRSIREYLRGSKTYKQ
ncbi:PREDICTED: uncharacterized protein LOC108778287 [Cyphomyrmex costatus]|uniref:uncharacterized protein LOC108778287 n=1 Tax=Cyphomyrmex costatus TaxID=456900 RepID=UPI0008523A9A|nr:PREDICTED: uncharacterized protein LOC108778287 [Cyphomyrmex costatus]